MKNWWGLLGPVALLASAGVAAHPDLPVPDSHAPAGVMGGHLHREGEIMTGYRYSRTSFSQYYRGSERADTQALVAEGYTLLATGMTMEMLMLDFMYAVSDDLTLMLMPHYMSMDMDMVHLGDDDQTHQHSEGHHGGHHGDPHPGSHSHDVSGFGDTLVSALYRLAGNHRHQLIGGLGVSIPTGSVSQKNPDGTFVHYEMQLGSGTWDLVPSLTYQGRADRLTWGAQFNAQVRLESENKSGYALGDWYQATGWTAVRVADWISLSGRLAWETQDSIGGHYNGPHRHSNPADIQANYGGTFVDFGLGANTIITSGNFTGVRFELEWVTRVREDYNGFQLGLDNGIYANISYAFR